MWFAAAAVYNEELANEAIGLLHMVCSTVPAVGGAASSSAQRLLFNTGGLLKLMKFVLAHAAPIQAVDSASPSKHFSNSSDKVFIGKALILIQQLCPLQTEEPPQEMIDALSALLHKATLSIK